MEIEKDPHKVFFDIAQMNLQKTSVFRKKVVSLHYNVKQAIMNIGDAY